MLIHEGAIKRGIKLIVVIFAAILLVGGVGSAYAITSSSNNYQLTEQQFSAGSNLDSCSTQYCAQVTIGDPTAAPRSNSASFTSGSTSDEPVIEVIIEPGASNLGTLTTENTATKTTTIRIRSFLSGGYLLQIMGDPPRFEGHTLRTSSTPELSTPGKEQFGLNLVKNSLLNVGENPLQVPDDGQIFGEPTDNYKTADRFMYSDGDVVARSLLDSGRTDYTITMMVNIASTTPAGHYSGDFAAIVMPGY